MSRSLARRLTVITAVGSCLAAAALPALAQQAPDSTRSLTVEAEATGGTRHFYVWDQAQDVDLERLLIANGAAQPFRVVVTDDQNSLSQGFEVSASMTNLYWKDPASPVGAPTYDRSSIIPSRNLSLAYDSSNPLQASGLSLPVTPVIDVAGTLDSCLDPDVASLLGLPSLSGIPLLGSQLDTLLSLLSGPEKLVCQGLGQGLAVTTSVVDDAPLPLQLPAVTDLLALNDLPLALVGGQQSGAFTNPAFKGAIAPTRPDGAADPTTKRVMTGTPQVSTSLLALLNATLTSTVGGLNGGVDGLVSQNELLASLAGSSPGLVTGLQGLGDPTAVTQLLAPLEPTLRLLDASSLTKVSGAYTARPVLRANTTAARPGTYEGTLTLDFFDGVE